MATTRKHRRTKDAGDDVVELKIGRAYNVRASMGHTVLIRVEDPRDGTKKEIDLSPVLDLSWSEAEQLRGLIDGFFDKHRVRLLPADNVRRTIRDLERTLNTQRMSLQDTEKRIESYKRELLVVEKCAGRKKKRRT